MPDGLWWLPSIIVFGAAAVALALGIIGLRRLGRRREASDQESAIAVEMRARGLLVQADNAVQDADDEIAFAVAQFGEASVREYRRSVATTRGWLREAFLLQQRLDDAVPDTAAERRTWSERIEGLCRSVLGELARHESEFSRRRSAERAAPRQLPEVLAEVETLENRIAAADLELDALEHEHAGSALADHRARLDRAGLLLAESRTIADAAATRLERNRAEPVAPQIARAADLTDDAAALIARAERAGTELSRARAGRVDALAALRASLGDGRRIRDRQENATVAARLNESIADADRLVAALDPGSGRGDPFVETARLREAAARLDTATAQARSAQDRLDNARSALGGALTTARSQIGVARDYIGGNRSAVGADARTRLAEAERQLQLAEVEADPVAALDTARRAVMHATDADALARYDAGYRGAL